MGWQDLLSSPTDTIILPWTGGRELRANGRTFSLKGKQPTEHGWHEFSVSGGRSATWKGSTEVDVSETLSKVKVYRGYVIGDRLVPDQVPAVLNPANIATVAESVYLIEPGLERFARIRAGRWEDGRLIYIGQEFPLGPEDAVTSAFQDQKTSVSSIPYVTPALDLVFRFETWRREESARLRAEALRLAQEEALKKEQEERRSNLVKQLGDGQGRRQMALVDFGEAARAALQIGNAEFLDWRESRVVGEAVVQFRFQNRRFECVCHKRTLRIIDAGVCLTAHDGRKDDALLSLESLPPVIGQAIRENKLVVLRHIGNSDVEYPEDEDSEDW